MPFFTRRIPRVPVDPLSFWKKIHAQPRAGFYFGPSQSNSSLSDIYMSADEPRRVFRANVDGMSSVLRKIQESFSERTAAPRFVGFFGFEAGQAFDPGIRRLPKKINPLGTPAALFGDFPAVIKIDVKNRETVFYFRGNKQQKEKIEKKIREALGETSGTRSPSPTPGPSPYGEGNKNLGFAHMSESKFSSMVRKAKDHIACGDIYQANLSFRFQRKFDGDPLRLYRALCERNPSPYSSLLKFGDAWIVSSSPELLFKVDKHRIVTRPIAGTRPRGGTRALDKKRRGQLLLSPKERAEHIMLVDLERNDLGRVCTAGSVKVTDRFAVEPYSHVMHIVSQVEGRLSPRMNSVDALKAVFPGGTITGCPKIKSIEIIEGIEDAARGPFYGSAGFFCENGNAVFNILIRTAFIAKKKIFLQAGAGIVADSHPKREYREVLAKAQALLEVVSSLSRSGRG